MDGYDPTELAQSIADAQAGARYFTDMAQALNGSLTWDTERMGAELYPVIMHALDSIEDAKKACGEASERLEARAEALRSEMRSHGGRKQIGVKIPQELYEELERLKIVRDFEGETLTTTDLITGFLTSYMDEHRHEIAEFKARMEQRGNA